MWRRTYDRLQEQAFEAEMLADEAFEVGAERLLARINSRRIRQHIRCHHRRATRQEKARGKGR